MGARVRDRVRIGRARRDGRTRGDAGGGGEARRIARAWRRETRAGESIARVVAFAHLRRTWRPTVRWDSALGARQKNLPFARGRNAAECDAARDSRVDRAGSNDRSGDSRRRVIPRGVRSDALCAPSAPSSRSSIAILTDAHTKTVIARARVLARSAPLRNTRILLDARANEPPRAPPTSSSPVVRPPRAPNRVGTSSSPIRSSRTLGSPPGPSSHPRPRSLAPVSPPPPAPARASRPPW